MEVDLVLEGRFKTIPVEIKFGFSVNPKELKLWVTSDHFSNSSDILYSLIQRAGGVFP
ncbi:MAG: hypothetical protein ACHQYQ_09150 [Bacteriovoracales bacterium]